MSGLTADVQVEDRPAKPRRVHLSDEYVSRLLDCLKHGRCTALLVSHRAFRLIRFLVEGNWRHVHLDNAGTGELRLTKARWSTTPKSAVTRLGADCSRAHIARITYPRGREASRQSSGPDMALPGTLKSKSEGRQGASLERFCKGAAGDLGLFGGAALYVWSPCRYGSRLALSERDFCRPVSLTKIQS